MTTRQKTGPLVLVADDDEGDRMLLEEAFEEAHLDGRLAFVEDGKQLLDYLQRRSEYTEPDDSPRPALILLDLNMPVMDGREALDLIKGDDNLRSLPVVVLTTSSQEEDVRRIYDSGGNAFISKPNGFDELVEMLRALSRFWFDVARTPSGRDR